MPVGVRSDQGGENAWPVPPASGIGDLAWTVCVNVPGRGAAPRLRRLEDGRDGGKAALAHGLVFAISGGLEAVGGGLRLHAAPRRAALELA